MAVWVMRRSDIDLFSEFSDVLSSSALHQFLAVQQWTLHSRRTFMDTWVHADDRARAAQVVHIPRDREAVDFTQRLAEAARDIATVFDWSLSELAEQVAAVHADLFYVRVGSSASDGTISLQQASVTIDAIEQMIKSAAIFAHNPHSTGRGRVPNSVTDFLAGDVRMGHTRRGSFIITVAARLQDHDQVAVRPDEPPPASSLPDGSAAVSIVVSEQKPELDFTRRVMTTLSRSLDATSRHLKNDVDFADIEAIEAVGVTPRLVEAIEEVASQAQGSRLDIRFEWAPILPETDAPSSTSFDRPQVARMQAVVERLKRRDDAPERITAVGPVIALSRSDQQTDETGGEVQVLADLDGTLRKLLVELEGTDYDWAIYAHQQRLPLVVHGVMAKVSNRWRMVDRVELDTAFLRDYQQRRVARGIERAAERDQANPED